MSYSLTIDPKQTIEGRCIHTLAARSLIRELESGDRGEQLGKEKSKEEIILLGTSFGIASKYTSFVCVEDREGSTTEESMELREVAHVTKKKKTSPTTSSSNYSYSGRKVEEFTLTKVKLLSRKILLVRQHSCIHQVVEEPLLHDTRHEVFMYKNVCLKPQMCFLI